MANSDARKVLLTPAGNAAADAGSRTLAVVLSFGSVITLVLAIVGLRAFLHSDYANGKAPPPLVYTPGQLVGFVAWIYLLPAAMIGLFTFTVLVVKSPGATKAVRVSCLTGLGVAAIAAAVAGALLARDLVKCGIFWCADTDPASISDPVGLFNSVGLWIALVGLVSAAAFVAGGWSGSEQAAPQLQRWETRLRQRRLRRCVAGGLLAVVIIPGFWLLTTVLPSAFKGMHLAGKGNMADYMAMKIIGAEVEDAWFTTANIELSSNVVLKVFPDTVIYYGFLEVIAIMSILSAAFPSLGKLLSRPALAKLSVGELAMLLLLACTLFLWTFYWLHDHNYEKGKWASVPEKLARTFGMIAVLFMSLTLLPATKNSLWLEALGISWESSLWAHRFLGGICLVFILGHVVTFWIDFATLDIFPHDILAFQTYYPMNGPKPKEPMGDDWTISMMQMVGYPSLLALGLPQFWRRKNWEIFKYFHYFFMALIPATLLHANAGWFFLMGSVAFWLVDAAIRFAVAAMPTPVLTATPHDAEGGVTEIWFKKRFKEPGQYCFVNVPEISAAEWHPFSLCSSPFDESAQMCIKNMGPDTFTGKLHALAKKCNERGSSFVFNVDGPYGPHLDHKDCAGILLLAGGIGVTPMHSTFRMLSQLHRRGELPDRLKLVRLVWIARSEDLFKILLESLAESVQPGKLEVLLYLDNPAESQSSSSLPADIPGLKVFFGRPSFDTVYDTMSGDVWEQNVLVKACGPGPMDSAAQKAASSRKAFTYESELFVL
eukprot:TRINITY_DN28081_c0_g1_i1.p1 TRINITY_DN28081_c0_g1~~TRINITY_DN28081_c0_g1_i1.p1  ORF type:complete len:772 (+),score=149.58 TRINITY_DN28081_c0_g1_i1:105-2420(+)